MMCGRNHVYIILHEITPHWLALTPRAAAEYQVTSHLPYMGLSKKWKYHLAQITARAAESKKYQ